MIAPEEYLASLLRRMMPLQPKRLPLREARGLIAAEDVTALLDVPAFSNSAMDGFAVSSTVVNAVEPDPNGVRWMPVVGDIPAGAQTPLAFDTTAAARIMTGAPMPDGADAVVKVEDTTIEPGPHPLPTRVGLRVSEVEAGANVRHRGEDTRVGHTVLRRGMRVGAPALGALVSTGHTEVTVYPRPRIIVITTGDELRDPGEGVGYGQIPDSNTITLVGLLDELGADVIDTLRASDNGDDFTHLLTRAIGEADAVITTGGVSAGAFDVVKAVGGRDFGMEFHRVAMQPGKPQGFGLATNSSGREVPIFALPGNPVSVVVSFTLFVAPCLRLLMGWDADTTTPPRQLSEERSALLGRWSTMRTVDAWASPGGKTQFVPVVIGEYEGQWRCSLIHPLGSKSHLAAALAQGNGIAVIPAECAAVRKGDEVSVLHALNPTRGTRRDDLERTENSDE